MFALSDTNATIPSANEPVTLEIPANVLERILHRFSSTRYDPGILPAPTLEQLHAAAVFHDKFDIHIDKYDPNEAFHSALKKDPFAALAYASQINDLDLGRRAIQLIQVDGPLLTIYGIWNLISNVKPTWQLAFARLILPRVSLAHCGYDLSDSDGEAYDDRCSDAVIAFSPETIISMKEVADAFDPK